MTTYAQRKGPPEATTPRSLMCEACWREHGQDAGPCDNDCGCHDAAAYFPEEDARIGPGGPQAPGDRENDHTGSLTAPPQENHYTEERDP